MASILRTGENTGNSETEEETLALGKKHSRRVSFADRETVHTFNRDEDYETPSDSAGNRKAENVPESDEVLRFLREFDDVDDSKQHSPLGPPINDDDVDDELISARKSFFRPIESPSPGSSIMDSATSVDDVDNFFGPVSASFIRPGRLSDSAASDDNREVTMDSTVFSMHYRSLEGSESGGAGERTPSNVGTPSDPGSFMVLTEAKKLVSESPVGVDRVISGARDSNDMSLVGEKPRTYDYGKLSPDLEVLLAEGRMSVPDGSVSESTYMKSMKGCDISLFDANEGGHMDQIDGGDEEVNTVDRVNVSAKEVSVVSMESDKMNVVSVTTVLGQNTHESSPIGTKNLAVCGSIDCGMQSPSIQLSKLQFPNSLTMLSLQFSEDTKHLTFPSMDKLNIREIGEMQGILLNLKKVKIFELFCSRIQSQKTSDSSAKVRTQRLDETRSLLCKLVYEKARMQLMSVKREKLQKRAQQLSSVIQKTEIFKSNFPRHPSLPGERATQLGDNLPSSCVLSPGSKLEVFSEKVATMRHEYEALERKIKSLTKSFHMYCKMKEVPSCSETIILLNDHIKKRTRCQLIREDLQLWEVEDFCRNGGQSSILLNYQGFIGQRFTINSAPTHSTYVANQVNSANILKQFPNMDACTAFAYVLNSGTPRRYIASRTLVQESQMISTLLSNLLDVVEEVQRARIEIKNLVHTSFHSPSVEQLDLQLCFVEFNSCGKVIVTVDLTCLKRGIYPSEILPRDVQTSFAGSSKSSLGSLSAEINNEVGDLSVGRSRIIRLCRCVSQVVQSVST